MKGKLETKLARFTGHLRISDFVSSRVPDRAGVYVILAVRKRGEPIPLKRLNGTDHMGILLIGKSKSIRRRIHQFVMDIRTPGLADAYHSAGWNFRAYFRDNPKHYIIKLTEENLEVKWKVTGKESSADSLETQLLQTYVMQYQGDKPPLNISIKRE